MAAVSGWTSPAGSWQLDADAIKARGARWRGIGEGIHAAATGDTGLRRDRRPHSGTQINRGIQGVFPADRGLEANGESRVLGNTAYVEMRQRIRRTGVC